MQRYAFELRDVTWHNSTIYDMLRRDNAAFCIYGLAGLLAAAEITADFTYVRLHGLLTKAYQGRYDKQRLAGWARCIARWRDGLKDVYVYFDHNQQGFAALNALELKTMVG